MPSRQKKSVALAGDGSRERVERIRAALRERKEAGDMEGSDRQPSVVTALQDEYKTHLDLYKHYLTVAASFNVFYYAVTGAVVSYTLSGGERWRGFALTFTVLMSYFFARVFGEAQRVFSEAEKDIENIADSLGYKRTEVRILTQILRYSHQMYWFNCFALTGLFIVKLSGVIDGAQPATAPK